MINKEYIAENLCENKDKPILKCDGKCHLAKQLKEKSKEEKEPSKPTNPTKQENDVIPFLVETVESSFSETILVDESGYRAPLVSLVWADITTPPPEYYT